MQGKGTSRPDPAATLALGRAVRETRARRGMSQQDLGFASGIHFNQVGAIERGEGNVTFRLLMRLAKGLDVPLSELIALAEARRAEGS